MQTNIIFACDESGAKGYANHDEASPGEIGVFAGILIPEERAEIALKKFNEIYDRYKLLNEKLHVTNLPSDSQESLREEIYRAIEDFALPCFWYSIHVAGLYDFNEKEKQMANQAISERSTGIKLSNTNHHTDRSMHIELFSGLYSNLIAFLEERQRREVEIEIRTDQIDSPIIKEFNIYAKKLLNLDPFVCKQTGIDTHTKKVLEGKIRAELVLPSELQIEVVVRSLCINPIKGEDGFVLAADVLANSLYYLFKNRKENMYSALNSPEAIADHPLAKNLDTFKNWGKDLIGDCLYRHPRNTSF